MGKPKIAESAFIAPGAAICGNVIVGENCSVYFNSTLRGDRQPISLGDGTNVQDNCVLHATPVFPVEIGKSVSIGHGSIIHGCTISDNVLVGMGSTIMNNAQIGENCIIGAGTLITQGKIIPPNSVVMGRPGKIVRTAEAEDIERIAKNAKHYMTMSAEHMAGEHEMYENK